MKKVRLARGSSVKSAVADQQWSVEAFQQRQAKQAVTQEHTELKEGEEAPKYEGRTELVVTDTELVWESRIRRMVHTHTTHTR